jgi:hypothetical protein
MHQQSPQLSLNTSTENFTNSTFYEVTVSSYAASEVTESPSSATDDLTFNHDNQKSSLESRLFLSVQQRANIQKLDLESAPAAKFSVLQWQWQDLVLIAETGFSHINQVFVENVSLKNSMLEITVPRLTIDLAESFAQSDGEINWQQSLGYGKAQSLLYQDGRLFLYQVESFIYPGLLQ